MFFNKRANPTPIPSPPFPPRPLVLSPTGSFDGDDGKWSTFAINIAGDGEGKGQNFKALMSTSSLITLVPAQTGWCSSDDCAKSRGIMSSNGQQLYGLDDTSPNWNKAGQYNLPFDSSYGWSKSLLLPETNGTLNGVWGLTTVGLGEASITSITLADQYVVMHYFKDFFLSSFGLAPGGISPADATKPTFFSTLASTVNTVASSSYGFTAGASYRNGGRGVTGNMVFGGYDRSRLVTQKSTSIAMPNQKNNTLLVGVESIIYTPDPDVERRSTSFTTAGFSAVIDSTLPYLVLPSDICDWFVQMFHLGFDRSTGLYTINSTAHEQNTQQNATVSFKIGSKPQNNPSFSTIDLPYAAFYLQASNPIYNNATNYFPIKKSSNGLYILGRTFLQEAYIVVDYERANFTVAPAAFPDHMPDEDLVTIWNTSYVPPAKTPNTGNDGLAAGAIAGIVIGIVAVFALLGAAVYFFYRRRRNAKAKTVGQEEKPPGVDTIVAGGEVKHRRVSELTGSEPPYSPQNKPVGYYGTDHKSIPELSPESHPAELYSPPADGTTETDYFSAAPKPRRRGATRSSTGNTTPGTPIAELAGDDGRYQVAGQHFEAVSQGQRPKHARGPSDNSLSTNIDEVLAGQDKDGPQVQRKRSSKFVEHTSEEVGPSRAEMVVSPLENTRNDERENAAEPAVERRPSHARGLSDTTVNSESTAVSQPTPDELESWARSVDDAPKRTLSG